MSYNSVPPPQQGAAGGSSAVAQAIARAKAIAAQLQKGGGVGAAKTLTLAPGPPVATFQAAGATAGLPGSAAAPPAPAPTSLAAPGGAVPAGMNPARAAMMAATMSQPQAAPPPRGREPPSQPRGRGPQFSGANNIPLGKRRGGSPPPRADDGRERERSPPRAIPGDTSGGAGAGMAPAPPGMPPVPGMPMPMPGMAMGAGLAGMGAGLGMQQQEEVLIPSRQAGQVIGRAGETINRLEGQSGAKIQVASDDGSQHRRVTISGTKEQVELAKKLVLETVDSAAKRDGMPQQLVPGQEMVTIKVPAGRIGLVIGHGGSNIRMLQDRSQAYIQVHQDGEYAAASEKPVAITGTKEAIETAKNLIEELINPSKEQGPPGADNSRLDAQRDEYRRMAPEGEIMFEREVPKRHAGLIIGRGGETIRSLQDQTGASIQTKAEGADLNPSVQTFVIRGSQRSVDTVKLLIDKMVREAEERDSGPPPGAMYPPSGGFSRGPRHGLGSDQSDGKVTEYMDVPCSRVGSIIGKRGENIKNITMDSGCQVQFDNDNLDPMAPMRKATLIGTPEQIAAARGMIESVLNQPSGGRGGPGPGGAGPSPGRGYGGGGGGYGRGPGQHRGGYGSGYPPQQQHHQQHQQGAYGGSGYTHMNGGGQGYSQGGHYGSSGDQRAAPTSLLQPPAPPGTAPPPPPPDGAAPPAPPASAEEEAAAQYEAMMAEETKGAGKEHKQQEQGADLSTAAQGQAPQQQQQQSQQQVDQQHHQQQHQQYQHPQQQWGANYAGYAGYGAYGQQDYGQYPAQQAYGQWGQEWQQQQYWGYQAQPQEQPPPPPPPSNEGAPPPPPPS